MYGTFHGMIAMPRTDGAASCQAFKLTQIVTADPECAATAGAKRA